MGGDSLTWRRKPKEALCCAFRHSCLLGSLPRAVLTVDVHRLRQMLPMANDHTVSRLKREREKSPPVYLPAVPAGHGALDIEATSTVRDGQPLDGWPVTKRTRLASLSEVTDSAMRSLTEDGSSVSTAAGHPEARGLSAFVSLDEGNLTHGAHTPRRIASALMSDFQPRSISCSVTWRGPAALGSESLPVGPQTKDGSWAVSAVEKLIRSLGLNASGTAACRSDSAGQDTSSGVQARDASMCSVYRV